MGMQNLTIKDETLSGEVKFQTVLKFLNQTVTVEDIIRERVQQEVDAYNSKTKTDNFQGLVQPKDAEAKLNGYFMKKSRKINAANQIEAALKAFQSNGFFMLIDDRQAESLTEEVTLHPAMEVSFVKLTPLVGG